MWHEPVKALVSPPSLSDRNHQPLRMAVLSFRTELSGCRRNDGSARSGVEPSTKTVKYWTFWRGPAATGKPPGSSSANCSRASDTRRESSSPTSCAVTPQRRRSYSRTLRMCRTKNRTTARRIRINRRGNGSAECTGSNQQGTPSGFWQRLGWSLRSFVRAGIDTNGELSGNPAPALCRLATSG